MPKIYEKGQLTLPRSIRELVGIHPGDDVVVSAEDDRIVIRKAKGVLEFQGPSAPEKAVDLSQARTDLREERAKRLKSSS